MKTNKLLLIIASAFFVNQIDAQIKVTPGGKTSIGYAGTPPTNIRTHIVGNTMFSLSSIGNGAMIRGYKGVSSASKPDYTWYKDSTTGIFHSASNLIQFTINGGEKFRMNSSGQLLNTNSSSVAATPDYSWNGDSNTGMFNPSGDMLGFGTAGIERFRIYGNQMLSKNTSFSASTPDYSWDSDANTGIYHPASDMLGFVTGGAERMRINASGQIMINTTSISAYEKLKVVATSGDNLAARFEVNHANDWVASVSTTANKPNSINYLLKYNNDTTRFYVAGSGWIYSAGNYIGSDINIKDDINNIDSAMFKINQIRGVTYKLKEEKQNPAAFGGEAKEHMGVIAQEIEVVAPQAVKTIHNGTKAVSYEMLVGLLIEGMKEQSAEIVKLKTEMHNCCSKKTNGTNNRSINSDKSNEIIQNQESKNWLAQNKPNPFNKETVIEYNVVEEGKGSILIFDMNGKLLKTIIVKIPGKGAVNINSNDLQAGMYYYTLVVNDVEVDTKKMILTQ